MCQQRESIDIKFGWTGRVCATCPLRDGSLKKEREMVLSAVAGLTHPELASKRQLLFPPLGYWSNHVEKLHEDVTWSERSQN